MNIRYRPQRGGLSTSLREQKTFTSPEEFYMHVRNTNLYAEGSIRVEKYGTGMDNRISPPWDTHIVTIGGQAVGFTDGPVQ